MKKMFRLICGAALAVSVNAAQAAIFTEDFEASFPSWESGWLGTNTNLRNYYGVGQGRGNNPDGLWISDNDGNSSIANIVFNSGFGSSIRSFSIDVTSWVTSATFKAFDTQNTLVYSSPITSYYGAYGDPGTYQTIAFNTAFGLSRFEISGGWIEGNTSIDNVMVNTGFSGNSTAPVPVPGAVWLFGSGLIGLLSSKRRKMAS